MDVNNLASFGASQRLVDVLSSAGFRKLYPPQVLALEAGLLRTDDSLVVAAPTASGKTLIAEMAALKIFLQRAGKIIYTVPLRALAREKYDDLSRKYAAIGMKVVQSTGDFDRADPWLRNADLIISTNEKIDSLLRHRAPWLGEVRLVIADEVHLVGDPHRGPTLEMVLTRLIREMPGLRVVALSATIPNAIEIAQWLQARLVVSGWRPVPLREGVYHAGAVIFNDGTVTWVEENSRVDVIDLALGTIREGGQAIVFVNTRKAAEAAATRAAKYVSRLLTDHDRESLKNIADHILSAAQEQTSLGKKVADVLLHSVAFHHAGIMAAQRKLIEDAFRQNKIRLLATTTTLAMGLNLPSRRVIIRDWRRFESGEGMVPLPVMEIKQMAGRAGRPGFDTYGEAVLVAANKRNERTLFERYVKGKPEDIRSRLGTESALRSHLLALIAGGVVRTRNDLFELLRHTLCAIQTGFDPLQALAGDILRFLESEGLAAEAVHLSATRFGRRVSELYIDPVTGILLREGLLLDRPKGVFGLCHMVVRTPDMIKLPFRQADIDALLESYHANARQFLVRETLQVPTEEMLSEIKAAMLLLDWIEETPEEQLTAGAGIGPGDLHACVDVADWLLYASFEIAKIFNRQTEQELLARLRIRMQYGVKEELLPLVSLKGIGRIRARNLFNAGYRGPDQIREADISALEQVPGVGRAIAEDLKRQSAGHLAA